MARMRLGSGPGARGRLLAVRGTFRALLAGGDRGAPKFYTNSNMETRQRVLMA